MVPRDILCSCVCIIYTHTGGERAASPHSNPSHVKAVCLPHGESCTCTVLWLGATTCLYVQSPFKVSVCVCVCVCVCELMCNHGYPVLQQLPQQVSQPSLTEAILQRHNETESSALPTSFAGKEITVNNRCNYCYIQHTLLLHTTYITVTCTYNVHYCYIQFTLLVLLHTIYTTATYNVHYCYIQHTLLLHTCTTYITVTYNLHHYYTQRTLLLHTTYITITYNVHYCYIQFTPLLHTTYITVTYNVHCS